jgi:hypothetical protein
MAIMRLITASRRAAASFSVNSSLGDFAMIECPYEYSLTDKELQKLAELSLTWSHTEYLIGVCLKRVWKLSDDEANAIVFPMSLETRLKYLSDLKGRIGVGAQVVLKELALIMKGIQPIRNTVTHAILIDDTKDGTLFHLRSKDRTFTKAEVFECEEITNYAAELARWLRYELGFEPPQDTMPTLPERPAIPKPVQQFLPSGKKAG